MDNYVISIGREYGSAGRQIAMQLAEELGIKCYDKELLAYAAKESGLAEELFYNNDEKPTNSFLYSLVMDTYTLGYPASSYMDVPISQKVFMAQYDAIRKLAEEESCVIVGRCADYALKDNPRCISVFIKADMDAKIKRIMRIYDYTESKARDLIVKTDKKRSGYYNFYSNKKWADSRSYDLCLDSSVLGIDGTVEMIKKYMDLRFSLTTVKEI